MMLSTVSVFLLLLLTGIYANHENTLCAICECIDSLPYLIDCSKKNMDKMFPDDDWPDHHNITRIDLNFSNNQLQKIYKFKHLPLESISYHGNQISEIDDHAFKELHRLAYLDLSQNKLTRESVRKEVFCGEYREPNFQPLHIKVLYLGHNQIHSLDKNSFDYLPELEELYLNNNPMKNIDAQTNIAITTLRNLKKLHLASTGLKILPLGLLSALKSLSNLILAGNKFQSVPEEIHSTHSLQFLNLNNNPVREFDVDSFTGLGHLEILEISEMPNLLRIHRGTFGPLESLRVLKCSDNQNLSSIHESAFEGKSLPDDGWPMREVILRGNALTYLHQSLLPWSDIEVIDIQGNPWMCDCKIIWIATYLLPLIQRRTPDLTQNLICKAPPVMRGKPLILQYLEPPQFKCQTQNNGEHPFYISEHSLGLSGVNLALLLVGILLLVTGSLGFALLYKRRKKMRDMYRAHCQIRYQHAKSLEDSEEVTVDPEEEKMLEPVHEEAKIMEEA